MTAPISKERETDLIRRGALVKKTGRARPTAVGAPQELQKPVKVDNSDILKAAHLMSDAARISAAATARAIELNSVAGPVMERLTKILDKDAVTRLVINRDQRGVIVTIDLIRGTPDDSR